jgi:predicted ATPase
MYLARILWLQGYPEQATRVAEANVEAARLTDHPLSLCDALVGAACPVALLTGDLAAAERHIRMLFVQTERDMLEFHRALGICFEGEILVQQGDVAAGLLRLRAGTDQLSTWDQYLPALLGVLAEGLAGAGQVSQAHAAIDEAIARSERSGGNWCLPELLRIKGVIILRTDYAGHWRTAQAYLCKSIRLAEQQGALSWKLRAATSLARLWRRQGRGSEGFNLLQGIWDCFTEGHRTADLKAAKLMLDNWTRFDPEGGRDYHRVETRLPRRRQLPIKQGGEGAEFETSYQGAQ